MSEQSKIQKALGTDATDIRVRTRAAVTYLNATHGRESDSALEAFMSIFHPEIAEDRPRMLKLRQAMRKRK